MSLHQKDFTLRLYDSVMTLTKMTWYKIAALYILISVITYTSMGLILLLLAQIRGAEISFSDLTSVNSTTIAQQVMLLTHSNAERIVVGIAFMVIALVFSAWQTYAYCVLIDEHIKKESFSFAVMMKRSFSKNVWKTLLLMLFFMVMATFGIAGIVIIGRMTSEWIGVILALAGVILLLKFTIVLPHFVIGEASFSSSIAFSFRHMTIVRCLKLLLIIVLLFLVLFLGAYFVGSFMEALAQQDPPYQVLRLLLQFGAYGVMGAFAYSSMMGIYYRYAHLGTEQWDIEDHLVAD